MTKPDVIPDECTQQILTGQAYERVRHSHLLRDKNIVDTGSFSVLFEGENPGAIYRLSTDNATHEFARRAKYERLAGVVRLFEDYGAVAIYNSDSFYTDYLWLAHLERLAPLEHGSAQREAVSELLFHLTDEAGGSLLDDLAQRRTAVAALYTAPENKHTRSVLEAMIALLPELISDVDFDLTISNFMVRPMTGEVVMSDPVHGLSEVSPDWHRFLETNPTTYTKQGGRITRKAD